MPKPEELVYMETIDQLMSDIVYPANPGNLKNDVLSRDVWHSDGTYLWQWSKLRGLIRMNRDKEFKPIPSTMVRNASASEWNEVSLFVHNQQLYLRSEVNEDQPFVLYDIETLQPVGGDPYTCPTNPDLLKWTPKDYESEEDVRMMRGTPICTDGEFIYMIASYKKRWSAHANRLVVEVYQEIQGRELVRLKEITLYRYQDDFYRGSKRYWNDPEEFGGFLNNCSTFTNGTIFVISTPQRVVTFDLNTGIRLLQQCIGYYKVFYCPKAPFYYAVGHGGTS